MSTPSEDPPACADKISASDTAEQPLCRHFDSACCVHSYSFFLLFPLLFRATKGLGPPLKASCVFQVLQCVQYLANVTKWKLSNEWVSWHRLFGQEWELLRGDSWGERISHWHPQGLLCLPIPAGTLPSLWALIVPWLLINSFFLQAYEGHASLEPNLEHKSTSVTHSQTLQ